MKVEGGNRGSEKAERSVKVEGGVRVEEAEDLCAGGESSLGETHVTDDKRVVFGIA